MLLPTIVSRCQTLKFFKPKDLPANPERLKKEQEILKELMPVINSDFADKFKYVKSIDFEKQDAQRNFRSDAKIFKKFNAGINRCQRYKN